jgi:CBS-domain-containing membrane protein
MPLVRDIMNPKLLYIRDGDRLGLARRQILRFGVTAVPVLDETHRPVGMVSLRDLADDEDQIKVSVPVATVRADIDVQAGAKELAVTGYHHLVVIDDKGVAVGMVSAIDFVRALVGVEVTHPEKFEDF